MVQPPRRWPHPNDLKPGAVLDFLKEHEPLMDQSKNDELVRVLCWALPLYHKSVKEDPAEAAIGFLRKVKQKRDDCFIQTASKEGLLDISKLIGLDLETTS